MTVSEFCFLGFRGLGGHIVFPSQGSAGGPPVKEVTQSWTAEKAVACLRLERTAGEARHRKALILEVSQG
ncbi:hypothetical protein VTI74DRAFT_2239 [Chaetomium olivicolor]